MNALTRQLYSVSLTKDRAVTGLRFALPPKYFWEGAERMSLQKQEEEAFPRNGTPGFQPLPCYSRSRFSTVAVL